VKLRRDELCPLHHSLTCCGRLLEPDKFRSSSGKWETVKPGVRRIRDRFADHPDGYRYKLSPAEIKKVLDRKIREQHGVCPACNLAMEDYSDIEPDHIKPKGMNGARADDRSENIRATHWWCNRDKGSKRIA